MKQINFSHEGGFPLEQETLQKLQTAYRSELYGALKAHLSIETPTEIENAINYTIAPATVKKQGWAIVHQETKVLIDSKITTKIEGILYPIKEDPENIKDKTDSYLKTTRTGTNLIYGTGVSQTAYFDYEAEYITQSAYNNADKTVENNDALTVHYYKLESFKKVKDIKAIEAILAELDERIKTNAGLIAQNTKDISANTLAINKNITDISSNTLAISKNITDINSNTLAIAKNINDISSNTNKINTINDSYLPINGSRAMIGPLTLEGKLFLHQADQVDSKTSTASLLALDNQNKVTRTTTSMSELIRRLEDLEARPAATGIPIGMIAVWGKSVPFPEGWEEYVPLSGRMPVGFNSADFEFSTLGYPGGDKNKRLSIKEMPSHRHEVGLFSGTGSKASEDWIAEPYEDDPANRRAGNFSAPEGGGEQFSILNPYRVVYFIQYTGLPSDRTKPTPPLDLKITKATSSSISLSWKEASDNKAVTNYLVSVNGASAISLGHVLSYDVPGLLPSTAYNFSIIAQDAAGNNSDSITITTVTPPIIPIPKSLTCSFGDNKVTINWDPVSSTVPISYLLLRRIEQFPGRIAEIHVPNSTTATDHYSTSGSEMHTHVYKVKAVGENGNESAYSDEVYVNVYPYDPSCFDVESLVTMASGQSKKLKNIVIGDKLQGFSFPNEIDESAGNYFLWNGKLNEAVKAEVTVVNKTTSVQPNFYEIKTADTIIKVTGEHPLLVTEDGENLKWISAKNVQQTMLLIDKLGKTKPIESISFKEEPLEVALLDVEDVDNYVISGIVAHNTKVSPVQ